MLPSRRNYGARGMGEEKGEVEAPEAGNSVNAAAIAAALNIADRNPALDVHVADFFDAQSRLTDAQTHHLHVQLSRVKLGTAGDSIKLALQSATLALLLGIVVLLGLIVRDATNDYSLTIETISVPPSLAARGYTAATVAEALRGKIEAVRTVANSNSASETADVHNGRYEGLKVEIPETGLSIDQIERFLHSYFGHSKTLTGAITDLGAGRLGFDLQISGTEPVTIEGDARAVDAMLQRGAEAAFGAFDPGNIVLYLIGTNREDEALAVAKHNLATARTPLDLKDWLSLSGDIDGNQYIKFTKGKAALAVDPTFWGGWEDASAGSFLLGHNEDALRYYRGLAAVRQEDQPRIHQAHFPVIHWRALLKVDRTMGDYAAEWRKIQNLAPRSLSNYQRLSAPLSPLANLHDCDAAEYRLWLAKTAAVVAENLETETRHDIARCRGQWTSAAALARTMTDMDMSLVATGQQQTRGVALANVETIDRPRLAEDLIDAGQPDAAAEILRATPNDCYFCERLRGRVDAARGDVRNADIRFANAIRQAPSLPFAYTDWAAAKLARRDATNALKLISAALTRSPNYPEANMLKGDVEMALGDKPAAIVAYRHALQLAPAWKMVRDKLTRSAIDYTRTR